MDKLPVLFLKGSMKELSLRSCFLCNYFPPASVQFFVLTAFGCTLVCAATVSCQTSTVNFSLISKIMRVIDWMTCLAVLQMQAAKKHNTNTV